MAEAHALCDNIEDAYQVFAEHQRYWDHLFSKHQQYAFSYIQISLYLNKLESCKNVLEEYTDIKVSSITESDSDHFDLSLIAIVLNALDDNTDFARRRINKAIEGITGKKFYTLESALKSLEFLILLKENDLEQADRLFDNLIKMHNYNKTRFSEDFKNLIKTSRKLFLNKIQGNPPSQEDLDEIDQISRDTLFISKPLLDDLLK